MNDTQSVIRIGTRASRLALVQAEDVKSRIKRAVPELTVKLVKIRTTGDRTQSSASPLSSIGGEGIFTKEIQRALLDRRVDIAVHSMKDLPTEQPVELTVVAVPERAAPNDVLISGSGLHLAELPEASVVATGSTRRRAQLLDHRPDLRVTEIRGNVDTRLRKLHDGEADAIVLAWAGLHRLGLTEEITEILPFDIMLPAAGQGALAVEMRRDDPRRTAIAQALHHAPSGIAADAERSVLAGLGGGCRLPIAVLCETGRGRVRLRAAFAREEDGRLVRAKRTGTVKKMDEVIDSVVRQLSERE